MHLGTTFSQIQCNYLGLDYKETLDAIVQLPLEYIRVCAYWDEIEPEQGKYNFEILNTIINVAANNNKKIILAVGMKAPRWPEFHFPKWIQDRCDTKLAHTPIDSQSDLSVLGYTFIRKVLERYKNTPAIKYIQIENEALNNFSFTGNKYMSESYVKRAVFAARMFFPEAKILLTNAINLNPFELTRNYNQAFYKNTEIADAVGINVYVKVPTSKTTYATPSFLYWWKLSRWHKQLQSKGIESWITEAQSEPWEYHSAVHTDKLEYPSSSPQQTAQLVKQLTSSGYNNILLWGCEYWYWHKKQGRDEWWSSIMLLNTV